MTRLSETVRTWRGRRLETRINDNGNGAGKPWPISAERPNSGIGDDCVQRSSCRTRALK